MKRPPIPAIRQACLQCVDFSPKEVRHCAIPECSLHEYRMNCRPKGKKAKLTPGQAIREYCIFCMGGRGKTGRNTALQLVRECHIEKCALHHLRPGQNMRHKQKNRHTQAIYSAEASGQGVDSPEFSERVKRAASGVIQQ